MIDKINPRDGALAVCSYLLIERRKYEEDYHKYKDMTDMVKALQAWIDEYDKVQSSPKVKKHKRVIT